MNLLDLRQLRYPKAFRISRPRIDRTLVPMRLSEEEHGEHDAREGLSFKEQCKLMAEVATELWRLRRKMINERTGEPKEEIRRAFRHVVSASDALSEAGVKIQDHTGQPYRTGLAVEVLAFQPADEVARETVIETIRPSVYLNNKQVQQGQVIVGTPQNKE